MDTHGDQKANGPSTGGRGGVTDPDEHQGLTPPGEKHFRLLAETMLQIVWSADASGAMDYYNQRAYAYGGVQPGDVEGWKWSSAIHPDDLAATTAAWRRAIETGETYQIEQRLRRADGEYRWHLTRGTALRDESGRIVRWIGTATDIHEQKLAEEALRQSEAKYRTLADNTYDWEFWLDPERRFLFTSPSCRRITGYKAEDFLADPGLRRRLIHPDDLARYDAHVREVEGKCAVGEGEWRFIREDGSAHWVAHVCQPVFDDSGRFRGIRGNNRDVTDRKLAESALKEAYEALELRVQERTAELKKTAEALGAERQRFNDVLDVLPAYVVLLTPDYHAPFANRFFRERFGEFHDRRCFEYLFGRSEPCELCQTYEVLKTGSPHRWEWRGPDGRDYDVSDFPFKDTDGSCLILEMGIDITKRKQAEDAWRLAGAYNRSLIEAGLDPLVTIGPDGKITDVNAATEAVTGRSRTELIGTDFSEYFTEPEKARAGYQQVFRDSKVRDYSLSLLHRDGHVTSVLYNASVYRDEKGNVQGVFAAARDVTERNRAEAELEKHRHHLEELVKERTSQLEAANARLEAEIAERRRAEVSAELARVEAVKEKNRLEAVLDTLPVGMAILDAQGGNVRWNSAFETIWGGPRPETRSIDDYAQYKARWSDTGRLVQPEEWASAQAIRHGKTVVGQLVDLEGFDGTRRVVLNSAAPVRDPHGRIDGSVVAIQDITEIKRMERELRESEERFKVIASSTPDHLFVQDRELRYTFVINPQLGLTVEDMLGKTDHDLAAGEDANRLTAIKKRLLETGETVHLETAVMSLRGEREVFDGFYVPRRDAEGRIDGLIGYFRNITQRKQDEESLRHMTEELARSNKDLEQYAYVISHDLKEPLRMVTGFTGLLKERYKGRLDAKADEYISHASDAALRMQALIDDLLAYSRAGRGKVSEPTDVADVLKKTLKNLAISIAESRAVITHDPLPTIESNPTELILVFQNLVSNALKFRSDRSPEVHIGCRRQEGGWLFTVRDNGIGIDTQFVDRIFMIFQRLHTREEYPGTGIGLAICRKIVERHGGRIWVESSPGTGSTFCFTIPDAGKEQ